MPTAGGAGVGRVAIGVQRDADLAAFIRDRDVIEGFELAGMAWRVTGLLLAGAVVDAASQAAAIDAALRGADVIVDVAPNREPAFRDDLHRAGVEVWTPTDDGEPDWASLLQVLATGVSVAEAAHACNMSVRGAYRRLAAARDDLRVGSTAAAVAAWSSRRTPH